MGNEVDDRLFLVSPWRDHPAFNEAERAALALAEAETRLADREDPVPDAVWNEAMRHYDEQALATLVLFVGMVNLFNRLNVTTRQINTRLTLYAILGNNEASYQSIRETQQLP